MKYSEVLCRAAGVFAICVAAPVLSAQAPDQGKEVSGLVPRAKPAEYQAQAKAGQVTIAADFSGHGFPTVDAPVSSENFVAVEVALYGPEGTKLKIEAGQFSLKINGKKPVDAQPWGLAAKEVKDPEWIPPEPAKEKGGGLSTGGKEPGAPPPVTPKPPVELLRSWQQRVGRSALAEGERSLPIAGLIFFQARGKLENMKSVELVYEGPAGKATLQLQ